MIHIPLIELITAGMLNSHNQRDLLLSAVVFCTGSGVVYMGTPSMRAVFFHVSPDWITRIISGQ